jgi:hypothetical protein
MYVARTGIRALKPPSVSVLYWIALIVYFWSLAGDGLWSHFAADDPMNLAGYQTRGVWNVLRDTVVFFNGSYRPLGGVFYLSIYNLMHLDPFPYRTVVFIILTINLFIGYQFVLLITGSHPTARLATFLSCYHVNLIALYYYTSMIYDILCFTFYFGALVYYLRCRRIDTGWTNKHVVLLSLLYIAALDAKEMALTLPLVLLVYELTQMCTDGSGRAEWWDSLRKSWKPITVIVLLTVAYIPRKVWGPDALAAIPGYHIIPGLKSFLTANGSYIENIFYRPLDSVQWQGTLWVWFALLLLIAVFRRRQMWFSWCCIVISGVPTAIIGRGGGPALYIPLVAWSLLISSLMIETASLVPRRAWRGTCYVAIIMLVCFVAWYTRRDKRVQMPLVYSGQEKTWSVLEALRRLDTHAPKGAKILFVDDPFEGWDMVFIARLWFRDPSLDVYLSRKLDRAPTREQLQTFDQVIVFQDGSLHILRK